MKVRIRRVRGVQGAEPSDVVLDVGVLRLGRGADLDLRGALVPPQHSEITLADGRLRLRAAPGRSVEIEGRSVESAELRPGTTFSVGTIVVRVLPPEPGEDALLEVVEPEERQVHAEAAAAVRRRIRWRTGPRNRGWLALAASCAVVALLWGLPGRNAADPLARAIRARYGVGDISGAHRHVASDCAVCHATPFAAVADAGCQSTNCHPAVGRHGRAGRDAGDAVRCAVCHPEHDGLERLVDRSDTGCAGCHRDMSTRHPDWQLLDASTFADHHGEFRPSIVVAPDPLAITRTPLGAGDAARERSGLRFSHAKHLAADLRAKPADRRLGCTAAALAAGRTLVCGDCHTLDAAGALMQPISYRRHCQACHDLTPSCGEPGYQVEHGTQPAKIARELEAFAAAARTAAPAHAPETLPPARRRPDADSTPRPVAPARTALAVADFLGEQGVCTLCHVPAEWTTAPDGARLASRIPTPRVVPTAGAPRWLPLARFSHRPHVAVGGRRGAPECTDCHAAPTADSSEAVLLPDIARCRTCHGNASTARLAAPAGCNVCHRYHLERHGVRGAEPAAAARNPPSAERGPDRS
jgi:hypothetical protein